MKKLNSSGIAHLMAFVVVVVMCAIGGVAYMVASSAGHVCKKGGPVSQARSGYVVYCGPVQVACSIVGLPAKPAYGSTIKPKLLLSNSSAYKAKVTLYTTVRTYGTPGNAGKVVNQGKFKQTIKAHSQSTKSLKPFKVKYATAKVKYVQYQVALSKNGTPVCIGAAQLPTKPVAKKN